MAHSGQVGVLRPRFGGSTSASLERMHLSAISHAWNREFDAGTRPKLSVLAAIRFHHVLVCRIDQRAVALGPSVPMRQRHAGSGSRRLIHYMSCKRACCLAASCKMARMFANLAHKLRRHISCMLPKRRSIGDVLPCHDGDQAHVRTPSYYTSFMSYGLPPWRRSLESRASAARRIGGAIARS